MLDVQSGQAEVEINIDRVGVKDLVVPLTLNERGGKHQHSVATLELCVELPANFKGTHMSRFIEATDAWDEHLDYNSLRLFLQDLQSRLDARRAFMRLDFTYFLRKESPVSRQSAIQGYACSFEGELSSSAYQLSLCVKVPVMTVCPCSKAISSEGAHSQRAVVSVQVRHKEFAWIEEFIDIVESSASSQVYPLLKREDEKFVTETSYANPCFVEDVVRNVASKLDKHSACEWFRVEVDSFESIHAHNAYACIEKSRCPGRELR